jgi:Ca2+-binding EF-hand superfamily protein
MKVKKADIKVASKLFEKFDIDKNGLIDITEFRDGVTAKLGGVLEDSKSWARAWERIDFGKSRTLSFNEFVPLCIDMKELVKKDFIKELFQLYDYEGDGKLATKFFKKMVIKPKADGSKSESE